MLNLDTLSWTFWSDESAVTAVEYALLGGLVAAALMVVFGTPTNSVLSGLGSSISAAVSHAATSGPGG
jgi:Flp pilus assembly pilin Flp